MLRKVFFISIMAAFIFSLAGCKKQVGNLIKISVQVKDQQLNLEVASTLEQMARGLSGRKSLCDNCGMLFDYGSDYQIRNFWMKGMDFPLDFIWLNDGLVIGLNQNVPVLTDGQVTRLQSPEKVNQVIEVNLGWVDKVGLKSGDKINLD